MSLLICTICEENREPVTITLQEANQKLGNIAKGQIISPGLTWPSNFNVDLIDVFDDKNLENLSFNVTIDEKGNYQILAPFGFTSDPEFAHYNHLFIMNKIIEHIKDF